MYYVFCVKWGNKYSSQYVNVLKNMCQRHITVPFEFYCLTEDPKGLDTDIQIIKLPTHPGIKTWWSKLYMFSPELPIQGTILYFDLDVAIVDNIDWMVAMPTDYFWTIRDFKYLQKEQHNAMNSSVMWFNVDRFGWVWDQFVKEDIAATTRRYQGDQDYLQVVLTHEHNKRYYDRARFQSWRWQCVDGGYNFKSRQFNQPGTGAKLGPETAVVVFHGKPKPHQILDPVVVNHWQ
jgi:hypothetical protein